MAPVSSYTCNQCDRTFFTQRSLTHHRRQVHPTKMFECHHCHRLTKTKQHLVSHMRVHTAVYRNGNLIACAVCSHQASGRKFMLRHYEDAHGVSLAPKKLKFKNYDEFLSWKSALQKSERCSYVAEGGPRKTANKTVRFFRCFRDGFFSSQGKGKRRLKVSGSCKINGICPSAISCSQDRHSGVVNVNYTVPHVGHGTDVGRLNLNKEEKDAIARKIAAKVPFDVILDDLREFGINRENREIDRSILVTWKDLWNIKQSYNLNTRASPNEVEVSQIDSDRTQPHGSTESWDMTKMDVGDAVCPSAFSDENFERDLQPNGDFKKTKEQLNEEFKMIMDAATCESHFDLVRAALLPLVPMIEAMKLGVRFKQ